MRRKVMWQNAAKQPRCCLWRYKSSPIMRRRSNLMSNKHMSGNGCSAENTKGNSFLKKTYCQRTESWKTFFFFALAPMSHFHGSSAPINLNGIWEEINNQVRESFGSLVFVRGAEQQTAVSSYTNHRQMPGGIRFMSSPNLAESSRSNLPFCPPQHMHAHTLTHTCTHKNTDTLSLSRSLII